jgi:large subunit ribosomal protein L17
LADSKLGRTSDARKALLRNMVTSLLRSKRIVTTESKAREARIVAERMITLAKRGDLHARRQALAYLLDEDVVKDLFENLAVQYDDRQGGYTRIIKKGFRRGDGAPVVILEMVE